MDEEKFLNKAYYYYPKNISPISESKKYKSQPQYQNLLNAITKREHFIDDKKDNFIKDLENYHNNSVYDFSLFSWNDRAYNIQTLIKREDLIYEVLCINISTLIPYFTLYGLKAEKKNEYEFRLKTPPVLDNFILKKNSSLVSFIENTLNNKYLLKKFPENLKNKVINDIGFQDIPIGNFTFFNAFFLERYTHTKIF